MTWRPLVVANGDLPVAIASDQSYTADIVDNLTWAKCNSLPLSLVTNYFYTT